MLTAAARDRRDLTVRTDAAQTLVLSIAHYSLGVANAIDPDQNLRAGLSLTTSLVLAVVITAGGLYLATRRLEAFALTGDPA